MSEKIPVRFRDIKDVNKFVDILSKFEGDFDLYCGRYCVDAKSILGILTMDLRNPMFIRMNCNPSEQHEVIDTLHANALA